MTYYKCGSIYTTQNSNVVVNTASGAVANFNTHLAMPLKSLKLDINATQDLHGYDYPWVAGGGKNLLDKSSYGYISNANIIWGGTAQGYADGSLNLRAGTYTLSVSVACNGLYVSDTESQIAVSYNKTFITFTITEDKAIKLMVYKAGVTKNDLLSYNYQLEKGSTATEWTPYENICPITGHTEAKIVRVGKNLLDTAKSFQQSSNVVVIGQNNAYSNHELFLKKGTYTIRVNTSLVASVYYHSGTTSTRVGATNTDLTFTLGKDTWISFYVYTSAGVSVSDITDFQLEFGSFATEYEPYAGTEVTVQFGQTIYKGVLDAKNSKVIATHVLGNFDGSNDEIWTDYPTGNGFLVSGLSNHIKESYGDGLCNILPTSKSIGKLGVVYGINSQYIFIMQVKTAWNISTVSDLRTFLASNPLQIMYKLAEPIEIPLSAISQFKSLPGVNNIFCDTGDTSLQFRKIG